MAAAGHHPGHHVLADVSMRKTKVVTIEAEGRDRGKSFLLTEMASRPAEKWADRAFLALAHSGVDVPAGVENSGMAGIAMLAHLVGHLKFPEIEPLMDEILGCVRFLPDPKRPDFTRDLVDDGSVGDDIEEVSTRQLLRSEVLGLHVNFSLAAAILNLIAVASTMTSLPVSGTTRTSRRRSARSSRVA